MMWDVWLWIVPMVLVLSANITLLVLSIRHDSRRAPGHGERND